MHATKFCISNQTAKILGYYKTISENNEY